MIQCIMHANTAMKWKIENKVSFVASSNLIGKGEYVRIYLCGMKCCEYREKCTEKHASDEEEEECLYGNSSGTKWYRAMRRKATEWHKKEYQVLSYVLFLRSP